MKAIEVLFWVFMFLVFYTYIGYGILLFFIIRIRRILGIYKPFQGNEDYVPELTLFVTAFNEKDYVEQKVKNARSLNYPQNKIRHIWVTDVLMMVLQNY
jgi:cellulose synthase/poly-beta-1,6-N-acetylglucosamine synthase-like glycosyltransferase